MSLYAYILRSTKDGKLYIGFTENLQKRLHHHNAGLVKSTKYRTPLTLEHFEELPTKREALKRERYLKSLEGSIEKNRLVC